MSKKQFAIPSLAEIKAANKVSSNNEPTLFKNSAGKSSVQLQTQSIAATSKHTERPTIAATGLHTPAIKKATNHAHPSATSQASSLESLSGKGLHPSLPPQSEGLATTSEEGTSSESDRTAAVGRGQVAASANLSSTSSSSSSAVQASGSSYRPHAIVVNIVQKKNPLMKHIRNVPWEIGNIIPDFELGKTTCALFLSVRYHSLHPNYIHDRLKSLGKQYQLRVLLVLVDTSECQKVLHELANMALLADLTLILSWSYEEAARYLETYKAYENKPPDMIMERIDSDSSSRVIECLTTVKKVNKTDAATLMNTFKTMEKLVTASKEELTLCPGLGPLKAQRLHDLFHEPFLKSSEKKPKLD